ncbi:MAG: periplasmic heavy metal sensor [Acidobacteria bacterium]|nr:MAG: periplasmic heavy metal sensor [Acidobacteriota bacterium]
MLHIVIAMLLVFQGQAGGRRPAAAAGEPPRPGELTPFERFVEKLELDEKQLPEVGKIFTAGAAEAAPTGREMIQARLRLVDLDGKPDDAAPVVAGLTAAALKMTTIDVRTYQRVHALLVKGQQSKSAEAFLMMAGLLDVATPRAGGRRGGGPGGGLTRMELLTAMFSLDGNAKKQVKSILDADYKAAASARDQWTATRTAIGTAIQSGKEPAAIEQAVTAHAPAASAVAVLEMKALAKILAALTPEARANTAAVQMAVYALRGAFSGKKWDVAPE